MKREAMQEDLQRVAPILAVRSVETAIERFRLLGFECHSYDDGSGGTAIYGYAERGAIQLHLARVADVNPCTTTAACYVYCADADELFEEWSKTGVAGNLQPPEDTPYGLREFAYIDPDGNLLRIGSAID